MNQKKGIERIRLYSSHLELTDINTGEILDGEIHFVPKLKPDPDLELYHRFLRVPITMMELMYLQNLTKTEYDTMMLLMRNSIKNNVSAYNEYEFSVALEVSTHTMKKIIIKLKKCNLIKRIKLKTNYSLIQISPHVAWYGDKEALKLAINDWPMPVVPKDKYELYQKFEKNFKAILAQEKKWAFYPHA